MHHGNDIRYSLKTPPLETASNPGTESNKRFLHNLAYALQYAASQALSLVQDVINRVGPPQQTTYVLRDLLFALILALEASGITGLLFKQHGWTNSPERCGPSLNSCPQHLAGWLGMVPSRPKWLRGQ